MIITAPTLTCATLFSGGGLADVGMRAAGFAAVWAVEYKPAIASVYRANLGDHIIVGDVRAQDYAALPRVDWLHASPECTRASNANSARGETELDVLLGQAIVSALEAQQPERFTLENVQGYATSIGIDGQPGGFLAYRLICRALDRLGYWYHPEVLNAADYGVPQTRRRLILRASRDLLRPLPPPVPWVGWYAAIEDLIPTLPPSQFAPWQLARLPDEVRESFLMRGDNSQQEITQERQTRDVREPAPTVRLGSALVRAFILNGQESTGATRPARAWLVVSNSNPDAYGGNSREAHEPAFTTVPNAGGRARAWLAAGRVVSMTPRALARLQSVPDNYILPDKKGLACTIIGNGVPCRLMETIGESW